METFILRAVLQQPAINLTNAGVRSKIESTFHLYRFVEEVGAEDPIPYQVVLLRP